MGRKRKVDTTTEATASQLIIKQKLVEPEQSPYGGVEINYKTLYFDSQKKIEVLTDENYQLTLKLQHSLGKLEAYETTHPFSMALEKLRDLILATNMSKATETVNVTSQIMRSTLEANHETRILPTKKKGRPAA
ncbi:hypothetical protein ACFE04_012187 [Oxalis oulophora]